MPARSAGSRLRRTWPQRLLILFNVCCIVAALAGAGMVAYAKRTVAQIPRVALDHQSLTTADELPAGSPQNFLIVGVDSDENLASDDPVRDGRDKGAQKTVGLRSDTIMVVRIDPGETQARILSFPRDLWVDIPGHGHERINAAMAYGADHGPALLMETIKSNFGIDINHYVQVDFASFKRIVDQIGGVKVYLTAPVRDGYSGLYQPNKGCSLLDSGQALAYARSRHLQYQDVNGKWRRDPDSDLSRIKRQQDFTRRVLNRAIEKGARNPATLARMVNTATTSGIAIDPFTTPQDLINLGHAFKNFDPNTLVTDTLPVIDANRGGAAVLDLKETEAEPTLALYRGTGSSGTAGTIEVDPATVTIRVVNGTGKLNQGADTTDLFDARGFKVVSPGADSVNQPYQTLVRYHSGDEASALLVARYLPVDPLLVPDDTVNEVTVVTGPEFTTVLEAPRAADAVKTAPSTTTSTTEVPSTTVPGESGDTSGASGTGGGADGADSTTSTTSTPGYLPGTPPPGESCG